MENESSKNCLPSDECTNDLDLFFANGLYNSCQATDKLIKCIEESHDEALARRALALYQRHYSSLDRPWNDVTLMYGLGLIYMHFNAYSWAIKAFRETIYVDPSFARSRDIHTRLGLIFKSKDRYNLSEKHFNLAINDTRPNSGTSTKQELEFHLAHLYEVQGKLKQAKEAYEKLLQENDLPHQLSANIHRQLGWMYLYSDVEASPRNNSRKQNMFSHQNALQNGGIDTALNYLNTSYRTDKDPKTSYYLGRCYTNIGKYQDAFELYRSVKDREESTADTWCSFGVLYHRQNQPADALQAYIRSVQFDKRHAIAWMNLGILYEHHNQFHDALKCYQHALRSNSNGVDESLQTRIKYIQKQMTEIESSVSNNVKTKINSDKLLSLEDLWNLESKISLETSTSNVIKPASIKSAENDDNSKSKKTILLEPITKTELIEQHSNGPTTVNNHNNTSKNISLLNNCEIKTQILDKDSKSKHLSNANLTHPSTPTGNHIGLLNDCKLEMSTQGSQDFKPQSSDSKDFCLNQVLTNGASKDSGISSNSSTYADCASVPSQNSNITLANYISAEQVIEACKESPKSRKLDINVLIDEDKPPHMFPKPPPYPPLSQDKLFPSPPSIFLETKKDLASKRIQDCCQSNPISIVRNIASVLKLDLGLFSTKTLVETNPDHYVDILSHLFYRPGENLDELSNENLWSCKCQKSSSTISRYASYQVNSFRNSLQEEKDSKSSGSRANVTKDSETDSNESASAQAKRLNINNQSSSQPSSETHLNNQASNSGQKNHPNKKFKKEPPKVKDVKSASMIDLSDEKKWRPQLNELNKLPNFMKCVSASNMLTHIGSPVPGINTTVMSMHVPGCRILGNKTLSNFCSININTGPGDYEWCAVSRNYGSVLTRLCNKNGFDLSGEGWWPKISDLQKHNIPIYRFSQRPGDLVWVNSGTIYWVQATGWCNSISWSAGPLSAQQYKSASESFELNKLIFQKSDVPMIQLTWNIIININYIADDELCYAILDVLRRSLKYCFLVRELIDEVKQTIHLLDVESGPKSAKFCSLCENEVFNIHLIRKFDNCLHCIECARRFEPTLVGYEITQDYDMKYLMKLYDNFIETKKKFQSRGPFRQNQ